MITCVILMLVFLLDETYMLLILPLRCWCLGLVFLMMTACTSSPQVIIFARYLSEQQLRDVTDTIRRAGLGVQSNDLLFPSNISQNSLIYSPMLSDPLAIDVTLTSIADLGWFVHAVTPLASQNHRFTHNTLGLYLLPEGKADPSRLMTDKLATEFQSRDCDVDARIHFQVNGNYLITLAHSELDKSLQYQLIGTWHISSLSFVELRPEQAEWSYYFEIVQTIESDLLGDIDMLTLTPLDRYPLFDLCNFEAGTRQ